MENFWLPPLWLEAGIILLLILINGFFAMAEIALIAARRTRVIQLAEEGEPSQSFDVQRHDEILLRGRNPPCPSLPWNSPSSTRMFPRCMTICGRPFTCRPS